jgi:signal transduction histidine kinase
MSTGPGLFTKSVPPNARLALAVWCGIVVLFTTAATSPTYNVGVLYIMLLVLAVRSRPAAAWALAILFLFFLVAGLLVSCSWHPRELAALNHSAFWFNRSMIALSLLVEAGLIHLLTGARQQAGHTRAELERQNARLQETNDQLQKRDVELDDQRRRFETVVSTLPFGITIGNADLSITHTNPAGAKLLEIPPTDVIDASTWPTRWSLFRDGREVPMDNYPMVRAAKVGETNPGTEFDIHFADGRTSALLISAAPILDHRGQITGAVAAFADITEQRQLRDQLETRRREAESASVRKTQMLSALSHDIRNPVNAIMLLSELILRSVRSHESDSDLQETADELRATSHSLSHMLSDMLDLARFDTGRVELNASDFTGQDLLDEVCRNFAPQAQRKNLKFICESSDICFHTDRIKLNRALANLIGNAVKFTESGEVRVEVASTPDRGALITVHDTGPGIPQDDWDSIFQEFVQLNNPERDRSKGTGLGLSICRRIVDVLGGTLKVDSEVGRGSTFSIALPATAVSCKQVPETPQAVSA